MGPKSLLEATWGVKKSVQAAFGLLDASWNALGRVWAPKKLIGIGSWTARGHRGDRFQHAWGPNGRPKGAPGGSQIGIQKRSELKMVKPCFLTTVARISMIFQVSGHHFGAKNMFKMGSEAYHRLGTRQKTS